jgi:hypothetical protein
MNKPLLSFAVIDELGKVADSAHRSITNPDVLEEFFAEIKVDEHGLISSQLHGEAVIVEATDQPIVATHIKLEGEQFGLTNFYGLGWQFSLDKLVLDEWDRFHGWTREGLPFVMSDQAQGEFFDKLDNFDDDSITFNGHIYPIESYWPDTTEIESESYWNNRYKENQTGWDLGNPSAALASLVPKLKLPSSRIIVLGGGNGHDAAFLADQGHHVTLVDISPEAINLARTRYGHIQTLQFFEGDLFELPQHFFGQFDLVVEHTCYCAINPSLRNELVLQWSRLIHDQGYLLGVFFAMPKRSGPPFGGSEWELRKRLGKGFQTVLWQRFRGSPRPRLGRELIVYAQKKSQI